MPPCKSSLTLNTLLGCLLFFALGAGNAEAKSNYGNYILVGTILSNKDGVGSSLNGNLRPFSIEQAKTGVPVVMKCGTKIHRFLAFDVGNDYPIVASYIVEDGTRKGKEEIVVYDEYGRGKDCPRQFDLFMQKPSTIYRRMYVDHGQYKCYTTTSLVEEMPDLDWVGSWETFNW